ncbi:cysteine proteinase [Sistotremastrum suecicum HHB10207 ss-3]|uniref:Ubiquitin carboxyl-terminal hydrolase n=1 Tax=Sistotremastrum suecicum HHB10207 ss-3 TaxID=1314776 RepID=A0A166DW68_9AGAM|nr:cysteine proteinase [Sistotremastrum suecicum HHB10207 ss-3]
MLAVQPLLPSPPFSPSKQVDEARSIFNVSKMQSVGGLEQLLANPIEFVEGSSTGTLAVAQGKYEPINVPKESPTVGTSSDSPSPQKSKSIPTPIESPTSSARNQSTSNAPTSPSPKNSKSAYAGPLSLEYPPEVTSIGSGLYNTGNTCFLNSVLQCLLHLPPILHVLLHHVRNSCPAASAFCTTCRLREVFYSANGPGRKHFVPTPIIKNMNKIAKHMRHGRQEDAHEFLRYLVEGMQKAALHGHGPKAMNKLADTTWVYKLFGGKLRSRVKCRDCDHPSDTFDSILDLSVDIHGVQSLKDALHKFVKLDILKGADKYKCEKCKKPVVAEKGFTIHEAPLVLTVHLKRFTPLGRKMTHMIRFDELLDLQPFMSKGQFGPTYRLVGVINHAGGGPNSGHYYSYVKSKAGQWFEMNDEMVERHHGTVAEKTAYILFYIQDKGQGLRSITTPLGDPLSLQAGKGKKRSRVVDSDDEDSEDVGAAASTPLRATASMPPSSQPPSSSPTLTTSMSHDALLEERAYKRSKPDPQAEKLKRKIELAKKQESSATTPSRPVPPNPTSLAAVAAYGSDPEDGEADLGEPLKVATSIPLKMDHFHPSAASPATPPESSPPTQAEPATAPEPSPSDESPLAPAPNGVQKKSQKRKAENDENDRDDLASGSSFDSQSRRSPSPPKRMRSSEDLVRRRPVGNPFGGSGKFKDSLHADRTPNGKSHSNTYSSKHKVSIKNRMKRRPMM